MAFDHWRYKDRSPPPMQYSDSSPKVKITVIHRETDDIPSVKEDRNVRDKYSEHFRNLRDKHAAEIDAMIQTAKLQEKTHETEVKNLRAIISCGPIRVMQKFEQKRRVLEQREEKLQKREQEFDKKTLIWSRLFIQKKEN
eukprot:UN03498